MILDPYKISNISDDYCQFEFFSVGNKGLILKKILFHPTEEEEIVRLALGDITIDREFDDKSISNNGDRDKILATVCHAIELHLEKYPTKIIYFTGSSESRNRLYRITINHNIKHFKLQYDIYVEQQNQEIIPFHSNLEARGFLIKKIM